MADITYSKFAGLYNKDDSPNLGTLRSILNDSGGIYLSEAINVDINDNYKPQRRNGYTQKLTGSYKSIWSNDSIILAVNEGNLVRILPDNSYTTFTKSIIKSNVGSYSMNYTEVGDMVYFTNDVIIGYIKDYISYDLPEPTHTYKKKMPAGHIIDSYRGRLYVAVDNLIVYSDPINYNHYDEREDKSFFQFSSKLTMMTSVADGMWISDGKRIMFLNGLSPDKMSRNIMAGYGAIEGTAQKIKGKFVNGTYYDNGVIFRSERGICIGGNSGQFSNLTEDRLILDTANSGSGLVITEGEIKKYICITK